MKREVIEQLLQNLPVVVVGGSSHVSAQSAYAKSDSVGLGFTDGAWKLATQYIWGGDRAAGYPAANDFNLVTLHDVPDHFILVSISTSGSVCVSRGFARISLCSRGGCDMPLTIASYDTGRDMPGGTNREQFDWIASIKPNADPTDWREPQSA